MRTMIFITIGLVLDALLMWLVPTAQRTLVVSIFTMVWLGIVIFNLYTGLSHGYTLAEELPIHLLLFGIPVLTLWVAWWWLRR